MTAARVQWRQVGVIAEKEFRDRIRNRWVLAVAVLFTAFALAIAYLGAAQQGSVGFRGIDVTIAGLVSLVIYLVPLIALLLGYDAIVGERDKGSLELLLTMPITRLELVIGKFSGLAAALAFSTLAGFGLAGVLLSYQIGLAALLHYAVFMVSALLLGLSFLSLAMLVSVLAGNRMRASGVAIGLWFFFVLVYDLLLLGFLVVTEGKYDLGFFPLLLMLNPADIFRILNVFWLEDVRQLYGLATVFPAVLANVWILGAAMALWIAAPLAFAIWRFR
ncbi:ABC transporter permease subunit [Ramlibacter solisilvae]|uniref:Membrane protein n=1 Tax=Ramlibacter tataouinensis TaxID=94132 RepID=A0A127JQN4_9BURK|nr:ABC transporter permease subunit [Ramlibacter tataouinensis]AMO22287.1 membrane protein [Ramlibacter tataouinensis]